jgi:RNA polymerase sigma-70 factor (ECF subfamily)
MEAEEFDDFYAASYPRLVGQLHAMIGDRDEAQECVQEAFVRAWSHRKQLDKARAPEAWVRTTAYRLALSRWRHTVRSRRAPDRALQEHQPQGGPTEDRVALVEALRQLPEAQRRGPESPTEDRVALVQALARLPEPQRRALVLHHLCDLSVQAVAEETGVSEGTVKARLARGRAALLVLLRPTDDPATGMAEGASSA